MRRADNQIQFLETAAGAQEQPGQRRRTRFALVFARLLFTHAIYSGWRVHSAWCILFSEARSVLEYRLPVLEDWSSTKWLGLDKVQAKEKVVWAKFAGRRKVIATYMRAFSGGIATYMRDFGFDYYEACKCNECWRGVVFQSDVDSPPVQLRIGGHVWRQPARRERRKKGLRQPSEPPKRSACRF